MAAILLQPGTEPTTERLMDEQNRAKPKPSREARQQLVGFMSNEEWDDLLSTVAGLLAEVERIPYPGVKEKVFALLQTIDAIHREPLRRLVHVFREGVLEKVVTDPAIHTLMELYDLLPADSAPEAQPLEGRAWKSGLTRMAPSKTEPPPHWVPALRTRDALPPGKCRAVTVDERAILLCRVDDQFFALEHRCAQGGSSLRGAMLEGYTLVCPNHEGCYYDVRRGTRIGGSETLQCYPVRADDDGRILIGFGIPFRPNLPSF